MPGTQEVQSTVTPPGRVAERGARESRLVKANWVPPVKWLNGEVVRERKLVSPDGTCREVWVGWWKKSSRGEGGGEKKYWEMVGLSLTTPALLTWLYVGHFEDTSDTRVIGKHAKGLTFANRLYITSSHLFPRSLDIRM